MSSQGAVLSILPPWPFVSSPPEHFVRRRRLATRSVESARPAIRRILSRPPPSSSSYFFTIASPIRVRSGVRFFSVGRLPVSVFIAYRVRSRACAPVRVYRFSFVGVVSSQRDNIKPPLAVLLLLLLCSPAHYCYYDYDYYSQ